MALTLKTSSRPVMMACALSDVLGLFQLMGSVRSRICWSALEGNFLSLIARRGNKSILGLLGAKLCSISGCSFKFRPVWIVKVTTLARRFHDYLFVLVILFVFSFIIKFPCSWPILVFTSINWTSIFHFMRDIAEIIAGLHRIRIIVPLMIMMGAWSVPLVSI